MRLFQHDEFASIVTAAAAARSLDEAFVEKDYYIPEIHDFGNFWPEVPETPHFGAQPSGIEAASAGCAFQRSPANRQVLGTGTCS